MYGTEEDWDHVWNAYLNESDASEKMKLLTALGHSKESHILSRYHSFIVFLEEIKIFLCSHLTRWGYLDLPMSVHPSGMFVTMVEKCGHLCPMDTFLIF